MPSRFDLIVVGGGPGGYVAAIKAAQLGLSTACIEKGPTLGGTCLNIGCIPSKSLLHNSHLFHSTAHLSKRGIILDKPPSLDLAQMQLHKTQAVTGLTRGIDMLFAQNKITRITGTARLESPNSVSCTGGQVFEGKNIILATGSHAFCPSAFPRPDEESIVTSTGALSFSKVPKHLVVIGAGVIGLELGSVWLRLGAQVTVVESLDSIGGEGIDKQIAKAFLRILQKQGMKFILSQKVTSIQKPTGENAPIVVHLENDAKIECDKVLVAVGRRAFTEGLNLQGVGIELDAQQRIPVNSHFQTTVPSIRAIGDVIAGPMLAHKAEEEGVACVESIVSGREHSINYQAVPSVIYTHPEVAWVGASEEQLVQTGKAFSKGIFPFAANSRARCVAGADGGETGGMVKVLADAATDRLLGVHIIGQAAGEMIHEAVVGLHYGASREDLAAVCHAHPTLSEAVKEACMKRPIHL